MEVNVSFVVFRRVLRRPRCVSDQLVSTNSLSLHLSLCCNTKIYFHFMREKKQIYFKYFRLRILKWCI
jgi:hypothetical protein